MVTKDASLGLGRVEKPALARKAQRPLHGLPRGHSSEGAPAEGCEAGHLMNPAPEHNDACTCAFKSQTGVPAIGTLALGTTREGTQEAWFPGEGADSRHQPPGDRDLGPRSGFQPRPAILQGKGFLLCSKLDSTSMGPQFVSREKSEFHF